MFDRQQRNSAGHEARSPVTVTMTDGEILRGDLRLTLSGKLADAMNNADGFLDFETPAGERLFLAKHSIRRVEPVEIPRIDQLQRRSADVTVFDPYAVLGLAKGASPEAVKQSYHALAKTYHPDRFASLDLPKEMQDYAQAMLIRINLAYQQLER